MDDDTEIELKDYDGEDFRIKLEEGQIWVNINNLDLELMSGNALISMNNGTANIQREENKNFITSLKNTNKVTLLNDDGENLNQIYLPVKNEITLVDTAMTPAYAKVKFSKLKKELKMTHLSQELIDEQEWLRENLAQDITFTNRMFTDIQQKYTTVRISQAASNFKNSFNFLIFNDSKTQERYLNRIKDLYTSAFYFASLEQVDQAKGNISKIDEISSNLNENVLPQHLDNLNGLYQEYKEISYNNT